MTVLNMRIASWMAILILTLFTSAPAGQDPGVTVLEDEESFTLSNGIVTATILKSSGDIRSLRYRGTEIFTDQSGHPGGYWSHDTTGGAGLETRVTIDPAGNGGARGEVSIRGISGGIKMGHGPGAAADGDFPADIEIRYALGRDDSGIYTYCIFEHPGEYDAATMTEARFAVKLADFFDWMSIDELRNKYYPEPIPGEDKYVYTAIQSENRAFGFSSTTRNIGFYFVNPTVEYLSGGPTKPEFLAHRDTTEVAAPVVLNYWRSSHYGGANVTVAAGEAWTRVVGPFFLYLNEGSDPMEMWRDARARADLEAEEWPYGWVEADGYAGPEERSEVTGRLVLNDPLLDSFPGKVSVGLAHPAYSVRMPGGREREMTWQTDAKHYQFWVASQDPDGRFTIPQVSPGEYALYAFADGVLGEFVRTNIEIPTGARIDLGELEWTPERHGEQIWEIGVPNRSGREFAAGDRFFEPGIAREYPELFPEGVVYSVGESEPGNWFFAHVPRIVDGEGVATPYTIRFQMDDDAAETGVLRLAIAGTGTDSLGVRVNGEPAGRIQLGPNDGVISRHQIQGLWYEREFRFDAGLLNRGTNTLTLTVPAGNTSSGVVYDYLRLELIR